MPNHFDVAAARLAQAAKLAGANPNAKLSRPMRLPDGQILQDITFTQRWMRSAKSNRALPIGAAGSSPADQRDIERPRVPTGRRIAGHRRHRRAVHPIRDFARNDRIVVYAPADGLAVYAIGADKPSFTSKVLAEGPRSVAWMGGNLMVWDRFTIAMLDGETGESLWQMSIASLPGAETLAGGGDTDIAVVNDIPPNGVDGVVDVNARLIQQQRIGPGGQIIVNGQARRFGRGALRRGFPIPAQPAAAGAPAIANAGPEQIVGVQPLSDRVALATTEGAS